MPVALLSPRAPPALRSPLLLPGSEYACVLPNFDLGNDSELSLKSHFVLRLSWFLVILFIPLHTLKSPSRACCVLHLPV